MKSKRLLSALLFLLVSHVCFAQTKHALIFAIGNYPAGSGWPQISSKSDVPLVKNALQSQDFRDIKVIVDEAATVKGISDALNALIEASKPGDIDVIHFSSHGEQIEDVKHHKADGLEECIVSYDAKLPESGKPFTQSYFESLLPGYYREDLFGSYVNKLRAKLGKTGDLVVFLDLCHAGTGTRGSARVRGGKGALVSPTFNAKTGSLATDLATEFSNGDNTVIDENNLATYVVFGAARANELDYEAVDENGNGFGSLSYALSKAFLNLFNEKNNNLTYRALFARVQSVMDENAANQHPVLAGNGADRMLFGGKIITQKPYIEIDRVKDDRLTVKSGKLTGLDSGAKVAVYPAGTVDPKKGKLIDTGTVVAAGLFNAEVQFKNQVALKQPSDGWVFVTIPTYKNDPLKVSIESNRTRGSVAQSTFSANDMVNMQKELKTLPGVVLSGMPELKIVKGVKADSIIIASTGLLFDTLKSASADTALLKAKITRYIQYSYLKGIEIKDPDALVDVRLVPVINGKVDTTKINVTDKISAFKNGEKFRLLVTNKSAQDVYVNILDMQPDGVINPLIPNREYRIRPEELLFPAGASKIFRTEFGISPPYGKEVFKIFVSTDMINMEVIATTRGAGTRGNLNILEKLVKKAYGVQARGAVPIGLGDANGSVYNLGFDIVK